MSARGWLVGVYFLTGVPSLIYQVVWQRVLGLYVGVDITATVITVSAFMAGLGLGALLGGAIADRVASPGRAYAGAELVCGGFGLASLPVFALVGPSLGALGPVAQVVVSFGLLVVPTLAMGTTFPLMTRAVEPEAERVGSQLSLLYAANTLGAATGALATAWWLAGWLGLDGTVWLAAGLNVVAAVVVGSVSRRNAPATAPGAARSGGGVVPPLVLGLAFASGWIALTYEIVWVRLLATMLHGNVYVFGTVLGVYLLGIGRGALAARDGIDHDAEALPRFAKSQLGIAAWVLFTVFVVRFADQLPGLGTLLTISVFTPLHPSPALVAEGLSPDNLYSLIDLLLWTAFFVLVPVLLMGYGFPQLLRAAARTVDGETPDLGRVTGVVTFANIVGSAGAGLVTGLVALRWLGSELTLLLTVGAGAVIGFALLPDRRWRVACAVTGGLALVALPGDGQLMRAIHLANHQGVDYLAVEDHTGVVALRRHRDDPMPGAEALRDLWVLTIDGNIHGGFVDLEQIRTDEDLDLALLSAPRARRALVIGLGDGRMVASLLALPHLEEVVVVELGRGLAEILAQTAQGRAILDSERVTLVVADGRQWLAQQDGESFDLVVTWPLHAFHSLYGNLYSREFFALVGERLADGGRFVARTEDSWSSARTFARSFRDVVRIGATTYVASNQPVSFAVAAGDRVERLVTAVQADRDTLLRHTAGAPINTDLRPNSEYYLTYPYTLRLTEPPPPPAEASVRARMVVP